MDFCGPEAYKKYYMYPFRIRKINGFSFFVFVLFISSSLVIDARNLLDVLFKHIIHNLVLLNQYHMHFHCLQL